jgi:hypothetical protein
MVRAPPPAPLTVLAVAALVLVALATGVVRLDAGLGQGSEDARLVRATLTGADDVALYQPGLAFVQAERTVEAPGGPFTVAIALPPGAMLNTLRVEGPNVSLVEVRSARPADAEVGPGDLVVVHVEGEQFRGTVLRADAQQVAVDAPGGIVLVERGEIQAIEVLDQPAPEGGNTSEPPRGARVTLDAPAGNTTLRVSYLVQGPGWQPTYALDVDQGLLRFTASLTGLADWKGVNLTLVAGQPQIATFPFAFAARDASAGAMVASAESFGRFQPQGQLGELQRFTLPQPVDFEEGVALQVPVLALDLPAVDRFFQAEANAGIVGFQAPAEGIEVPVLEKLGFTNVGQVTLPPGVVDAYREGTWVGQDRLGAVPPQGEANLTLATATDVQARLHLLGSNASEDRTTQTWSVDVANKRPANGSIPLRVVLSFPPERTNVLSTQPQADEVRGDAVVWSASLGQGANATFRATLETLQDQPPVVLQGQAQGSGASDLPTAAPQAPQASQAAPSHGAAGGVAGMPMGAWGLPEPWGRAG